MCVVTISRVHGIVPPLGAGPTILHVTGTLLNCASGHVVVDSPGNGTSTPTGIDALGHFFVDLPVVQANLACGDTVTVNAHCDGDPNCNASFTGPLDCCEFGNVFVAAVIVPGSLSPTVVRVSGTVFGCYGGPITGGVAPVSFVTVGPLTIGATQVTGSGATSIDPSNGAFTIDLPVTGTVPCDADAMLALECTQNPGCHDARRVVVDCPQCIRAAVTYATTTPCAGTPPNQSVGLTLNATISVPKGTSRCFRWSFGDGSTGPIFTIPATGVAPTSNTQYPHAEPHVYGPGTYSARLLGVDCATQTPIENCDVPLTVIATCGGCCEEVVATIDSQPLPCVPIGSVSVPVQFSATLLPSGCTGPFEWKVTDISMGGAGTVLQPYMAGSSVFTYQFPKGTYRVNVRVLQSNTCDDPALTDSVTFVIDTCTPCAVTVSGPQQTPCTDGPPTAPQTYTAATTSPFTGAFSWEVKNHATQAVIFQSGPSGPMLSFSFPGPGTYDVIVSFQTRGCVNPTAAGTLTVTVPRCCPQLTGLTASPVPGAPCSVVYTAQVTNPGNAPVTFEWSFPGGITQTTAGPVNVHQYPPSTTTTGATVTLHSPNCTDQMAPATITLGGCMCPTVGVPVATVAGCSGPGSVAAVSLATSVSPPGAATSITWTVTTPAGTVFTKTTPGTTTTDGVGDGTWLNTATGATGPLDMTASGAYAVSIVANGAAIPSNCAAPAPKGFSTVCPTTPTMGPLSCTIWCVLAGIFLIAVPISAFISTVAHCLLGPVWNIALQGGIIATAIGIFIGLCGICCLWLFLLIGAGLGIVATIIAAYWLGFPACWYIALPILIGFIALGLGMLASCSRR